MNDIYPIYRNSFGMSFQWKRNILPNSFNKFQIIFRDMGFYLTINQIKDFSNQLHEAKKRGACSCSSDSCYVIKSILLKTPFSDIDLAVNSEELALIDELILGTLFQIELNDYLNKVCKN